MITKANELCSETFPKDRKIFDKKQRTSELLQTSPDQEAVKREKEVLTKV